MDLVEYPLLILSIGGFDAITAVKLKYSLRYVKFVSNQASEPSRKKILRLALIKTLNFLSDCKIKTSCDGNVKYGSQCLF